MIYSSKLDVPLFTPKPIEMRFRAKELSHDVCVPTRGPPQQHLPTWLAKHTVVTWCVLKGICDLPVSGSPKTRLHRHTVGGRTVWI